MPVSRLQYNWDNNYTKKEKRMILLTQETIDKINNITTEWIDAVVETCTHTPYQTMTFAQLKALWDMDLVVEELNKAPLDYYNSLIDEGMLRSWIVDEATISENGETAWRMGDYYAYFYGLEWFKGGGSSSVE